ncbi:uncharacterized protein [Macrobrachium rosenbergii]|uniref:uncharacterized protein n=1 Tax=Macrobrachium rosenbergii TaxID=79674 RepID=UPI0034D7656A
MFLDTGSQRSFISTSLACKLKLKVIREVKLNLASFASQSVTGEYETVGGRVHLGKRVVRVKLVVHDHVVTPIHNLGLESVKKQLEDCWWRLDTLGISPDEQYTEPEITAMIQVQQSVVKMQLGYQVSLPFKGMQCPSNNYCNAAVQLSALEKQFQKDPGYRESYQRVLDTYLSSGFIGEVSDPRNNGYFMHYFGVRKESSTTPLRIVFNASSRRKGELSLNDCLYTGPNLVELLYDLLLRFRSNPYAVISDIIKASL